MRIAYVSPFRLPFNLPKDILLAYHDEWVEIFNRARAALDPPPKDLPANIDLGNYGWGLLKKSSTREVETPNGDHKRDRPHPERLHGEKGIEDPTRFFRDYHTLRFGDELPVKELPFLKEAPELSNLIAKSNGRRWQCRLVDNTVAVLVLEADLSLEDFSHYLGEHVSPGGKTYFIEFGKEWGDTFFKQNAESIEKVCRWGRDHLVTPMKRQGVFIDDSKEFFVQNPAPLYPLPEDAAAYYALWPHCAFAFTPEEKEALEESKAVHEHFATLFAPVDRHDVRVWLGKVQDDDGKTDDNVYGWGVSTVKEETDYRDQWLDGLCISEYYYTCIDIADTALPWAIARQRTASERRQFHKIQSEAQNMKQVLHILRNDYSDVIVRSSGEGYKALRQYFDTWRMEKLLDGLNSKLNLLEDLITASTDSINQEGQNKIKYILTLVTFLGLISLIAGIHDYLAGGYDPRQPELLPSLALTASKVVVLAMSFAIALVGFIAFLFYSRRK